MLFRSPSCPHRSHGFVECDADLLDSALISLLRLSTNSFVSKLVSGPNLVAEMHHNDPNMVVQAQVSFCLLHQVTPVVSPPGGIRASLESSLDPQMVYPIIVQTHSLMAIYLHALDQTHTWGIACIQPNDSASPNSFDKCPMKSQLRAPLAADSVAC